MHELLQLQPMFRERVWGGDRLVPGSAQPIGEAWVVFEECVVSGGGWDGRTLAEVTRHDSEGLLGSDVVRQTGERFPLLIKLLHSREWLSVQVHPNDEQAERLEGSGYVGKTEAWHILEAEDDAQVVFGLQRSWSKSDLVRMIEAGTFERALRRMAVTAGDTLFTPAGCVHAIGPGLFLYEVQQTSDITYRLFDWNRPASAGRELHLDKGLAVIGECGSITANTVMPANSHVQTLTGCDYFTLDRVQVSSGRVSMNTEGRSFHALTVIRGDVNVTLDDKRVILRDLESVIVPAAAREYLLEAADTSTLLLSRVC